MKRLASSKVLPDKQRDALLATLEARFEKTRNVTRASTGPW